MGRGRSLGDSDGLGGAGGAEVLIAGTMDVWSFRHNPQNEPFVNQINESVRTMEDDFPGLMSNINSVDAATLAGDGADSILGFYERNPDGRRMVALNSGYVNPNKMNMVYDASIAEGYHPPRGNRTGTEAVTYHEMGHALSGAIADRMNEQDYNTACRRIVLNAYRSTGGKGGIKTWAGGISGYATTNNQECIAEACADWYCNGSNAKAQSKAVMSEMRRIFNGG